MERCIMLSNEENEASAIIISNEGALSDEQLSSLLQDAIPGQSIDADVFTYGGQTLVIARSSPPLSSRFSARLLIKHSRAR